jgi:hypothetical protein
VRQKLIAFLRKSVLSIEMTRFVVLFLLLTITSTIGWQWNVPGMPLFYIDLLLLAPFLQRRAAQVLVIISLTIAIIRVVQWLYGFDQLFVSLYLLMQNLPSFPLTLVLFVTVCITLTIAVLSILMGRLPTRQVSVPIYAVILTAGIVLAVKHYEDDFKLNLIGTSYGYLFGSVKFANMLNSHYRLPLHQGEGSPGGIGERQALIHGTNYVLIIVESFGEPRDKNLHKALFSSLDTPAIRDNYAVTIGATTAKGSTIHGEIRELCGGELLNGLFGEGDEHCLPKALQLSGYRSVAVHANHESVYGRNVWYRKIGFPEYVNSDTGDLPVSERPDRWGTLLDNDTIGWVEKRLNSYAGKQFIYLLTVSTHLPAKLLPNVTTDPVCATVSSEHACVHLANLRSVIERIAALAQRSSNTTFVFVGDHPPPFVSPASRSVFSSDSVPYAILVPYPAAGATVSLSALKQ